MSAAVIPPFILTGSYQPGVVALSLLVAFLAAYTALVLAGRVTRASTLHRAWQAGGAVALGVGIWAMHFIAMLAFSLPVALTYDPLLTWLSLAIAIAVSAMALVLVNRAQASVAGLLLGGTLIGLGISGMHYTGMAALRQSVCLSYDPPLLGVSVAIAIAAACAALWLMYRIRPRIRRHMALFQVAGALVMGGAIAGMHYTGMAATTFEALADAPAPAASGLEPAVLSIFVSLGAIVILGTALLAALLDDRFILGHIRGRTFWNRSWVAIAAFVYLVAYWLLEAGFHSFVLGEMSFREALLPQDHNELWMRAVICLTALVFGLLGQRLYSIAARLMREVEQARATLETRVEERTEALRDSEQLIRDILDASHEAFVSTNSHGRIIDWNPAAQAMFGWPSHEVIGRSIDEQLFPQAPGAFLALAGGPETSDMHELEAHRRDGSSIDVELSISPLPMGRGVIYNAFIRDITQRKQAEAEILAAKQSAEQANRMKSEFLANMSHELRTPLNAILGFTEVVRDGLVGELNPQQRDYLGEVFQSSSHLLSLINDILDLSKVEAGKMELDLEPVDVPSLLANSLSIVKEKAYAHGIELALDIGPEVDSVELDARRFKQIVYNLLSNAVKFTPDGGRVGIEARCEDGKLRVIVRDTGIGIAAADLERLFQPFRQLDGSMSRQHQGTGLGLSLVRHFAELHGGQVTVDSRVGEGSRFTVEIPCLPAAPRNGQAGRAGAATAKNGGSGHAAQPLILLVEDNEQNAALMLAQLRATGYRTLWARSGEEALDLADEVRPDLVLLDILLPGIDGWEVLQTLKASPGLADIPVIVASIVADANHGFSLGALEVLEKPLRRERLLAVLAQALAGRVARGQRPRVLVADDDPRAVELVATLLGAEGYSVLRAGGGAEAIEIARQELPDLLILDLMMPEVTGFDVLATLRDAPETAGIPAVVLSAKVLDPAEHRLLREHAALWLEKQEFDAEAFRARIREVLKKRSP